jgi:hypothetical protein
MSGTDSRHHCSRHISAKQKRDTAETLRGRRPFRLVASSLLLGLLLSVTLAGAANATSCSNPTSLPECRAYEQVSPVEKSGFDAPSVRVLQFPVQTTGSGNSIAYMSIGSFAGPAAALLPSAYISTRGDAGWQTKNVTPPTLTEMPITTTEQGYGYDFSPDLANVVLKLPFQALAPVSEPTPPGAYNLFLHGSDGSYKLVTAAPPANPPGGCEEGWCFEEQDVPAFMGGNSGTSGTPEFTHVLFEENESLLTTPMVGSARGVENLYESNMTEPAESRVHPVGVLPDGSVAAGGSVVGSGVNVRYSSTWIDTQNNGQRAERAISRDGSHVVFQAAADGGIPDPSQSGLTEVYDRVDASSTIELSAPAPGATPANTNPEPAQFWAASADGSKVFFTSSAELTTQSNTGPENGGSDLYVYDTAAGSLSDLTVDAADPTGAGVMGVLNASEDGSYVYFVAAGQLVAGKGVAGEPNLYVSHNGGAPVYITTLAGADGQDWTSNSTRLNAYVTPDGKHAAFMSVKSLTGYDNHDQSKPGELDSQVYEYSAESEQLVCASCDPSGARPIGSSFLGFSPFRQVSTPFHHPRLLSNDGGRVFFSTTQPTVPETSSRFESNNVFEYRDGKIYELARNAYFLDASESGSDAFIATREQLSAGDRDETVDVYDARVDGGFAHLTPVPCAESECRQPYAEAPSSVTPSSTLFTGAGNMTATPAVKPPASSGLTSKQRLARALRACAKLKKTKQRQKCIAVAKRRYAPHGKKATHTGADNHARPR